MDKKQQVIDALNAARDHAAMAKQSIGNVARVIGNLELDVESPYKELLGLLDEAETIEQNVGACKKNIDSNIAAIRLSAIRETIAG